MQYTYSSVQCSNFRDSDKAWNVEKWKFLIIITESLSGKTRTLPDQQHVQPSLYPSSNLEEKKYHDIVKLALV